MGLCLQELINIVGSKLCSTFEWFTKLCYVSKYFIIEDPQRLAFRDAPVVAQQ